MKTMVMTLTVMAAMLATTTMAQCPAKSGTSDSSGACASSCSATAKKDAASCTKKACAKCDTCEKKENCQKAKKGCGCK